MGAAIFVGPQESWEISPLATRKPGVQSIWNRSARCDAAGLNEM